MLRIFKTPKDTPLKHFNKTNNTHVIELYCDSDKYQDQVRHEIISGADSGPILAALYGQDVRFVYAPDYEKFDLILEEAKKRGYKQTLVNLYEPDNVTLLLCRINPGDSILINGQADISKGLIAGLDAEDLIDLLDNDLELAEIPLCNLDIDSCKMGRFKSFHQTLMNELKNFQTITTYTELCSATGGLEDSPSRK